MTTALPCPDLEELRALVEAGGAPADIERLARHLEECETCGEAVETLWATDATLGGLSYPGSAPLPGDESVERMKERLRALEPAAAAAATCASGEATEPALPLVAPEAADGPVRLGPYRLLRRLGAGGMGVVYLAEDTLLRRPVAIKIMRPAAAADPEARERFLREARSAASVRHDHIVTIHHVGEDAGVPFLVMEFLEGEALDDRMRRDGRLAPAEAVRLGREAAEGLAAAHALGLVHRDVKPGNIWLEAPGGRVKLLDFGLARPGPDTARLTQSGAIVGTPEYMAPEQARGRPVDARADLFGLGAVLYRALAGRAPFRGDDTIAVLTSLALDTPAPLSEVNPQVQTELSELVARLLAKRPEDRPDSARQVAEALAAIERGKVTPAAAPKASPARRRPRWPVPVALGLLVVLGAAAAHQIIIRISDRKGNVREVAVGKDETLEIRQAAPAPAAADAAQPFVILRGGKPAGEFRSFILASAELRGGDVVEVRGHGPFTLGPVELAGKSLTLRAAPGYRPRFEPTASVFEGDRFWIRASGGDVTLEGCDFVARPRTDVGDITLSLFKGTSAGLSVRNCRLLAFTSPGHVSGKWVRIEDSLVFGLPRLGAGTEFHLENSLVSFVYNGHPGEPPLEAPGGQHVTLRGNTVVAWTGPFGSGLFRPESGAKRVTITAEGNVFDFTLDNGRNLPLTGTHWRGGVTWIGRNNFYCRLGAGDKDYKGLAGWAKLTGRPEEGSCEAGGRVSFALERAYLQDVRDAIPAVRQVVEAARRRAGLSDVGPDFDLVGPGQAYVRALAAAGTPVPAGRLRPDPEPDGPCVLLRGGEMVRGFSELRDAAAAAKAGDVIEVRSDGELQGCDAAEGRGALTVRAAPGYRPTLVSPVVIRGGTRLTFEGFHLKGDGALHTPSGGGTIARLANCSAAWGGPGSLIGGAFAGADGRPGEVVNCFLLNRVLFSPVGSASVRNSVVAAVTAEARLGKDTIGLDRCAVWNVEAWNLESHRRAAVEGGHPSRDESGRARELRIPARRTFFECGSYLFHPGAAWDGERNLYRVGATHWTSPHGGLAGWRARTRSKEDGSVEADPLLWDPQSWRLLPSSAGHKAGPGGRDYGADVDRVARPNRK